VFLAGVWRTRYVSLGSIAGVLALVAMAFAREPRVVGVAALVTAALIVIRHRENIERLRAGTERRLGRNA
jgi:glycerol-3-phosphate acyltransferase PlsY